MRLKSTWSRGDYPCVVNHLGDHVRKRRLDLGHLQREVALKMGVNVATIGSWERGQSSPNLRRLPAILKYLESDPRPPAETLGQALKRHRKWLGMSQRELAALLDVDPSTVAKWERSERIPTGRYLHRVERLLQPSVGLDIARGLAWARS